MHLRLECALVLWHFPRADSPRIWCDQGVRPPASIRVAPAVLFCLSAISGFPFE
jgi:hypothetical protein